MITKSRFLAAVSEIAGENPRYVLGGDGSNGACDCIGLVIGAIRRAGGAWTGTHGSNYAARNAVGNFRAVSRADELRVGEVVFKAHEPGDMGYALPSAYAGNIDARDYYHAGVVMSVNPLDITHCTDADPAIRHDSVLGRWAYAGALLSVSDDEDEVPALYQARVTTEKDPLRLRATPKTGTVIGKIPRGATVDVLDRVHEGWPRVRYGAMIGYVSAEYLTRVVISEMETTSDSEIPNNSDGAENATTQGVPENPTGGGAVIIDDAGNVFRPMGGWRVLIGAVD